MRAPWDNSFRLHDRACFTGGEIALAALTIGSTVISAAGSMAQGQAAASAAAANAAVLRQQAQVEQQQGQLAYQQKLRESAIARGKSLAVLSGSGVDPTSGSPLDLLSQQARTGEFNAEETKFQYDENAWKMMVGASEQDLSGSAALSKGTSSAIGGVVGGVAKGLGQLNLFSPADPGAAAQRAANADTTDYAGQLADGTRAV